MFFFFNLYYFLYSSFRSLQIEGNTFKIPRIDILKKGTNAILDYLKGRIIET
jgi:hypothetical protein